jgi:hypothetical protein
VEVGRTVDDPEPQEQSPQPKSQGPGGQSEDRRGPNGVAGDDSADAECRSLVLGRLMRWLRRHALEIMAGCAILALLSPVAVVFIQAALLPPAESGQSTPTGSLLNVVPQVRRVGVDTWGALVAVPGDGAYVAFGMRLESTGAQPITGLVARATLPPQFTFANGKCRYGLNHPATTGCTEALLSEDGIQLPDLQPGDWLHIVFLAEIAQDVPGNEYVTALRVASDQTGEIYKSAAVEVPETTAEAAVRGLFSQVEGEVEFWNGKPSIADRSRRFLILGWSQFTLEHAHAFEAVPGGPPVNLGDLFYERANEGHVVELKGRVSGRPWNLAREDGVMKQSYEVEARGQTARLRCYTARPVRNLLGEGDEVEIKAIPIAWSPPGSDDELTMAVCPAVRIVPLLGRSRNHGATDRPYSSSVRFWASRPRAWTPSPSLPK